MIAAIYTNWRWYVPRGTGLCKRRGRRELLRGFKIKDFERECRNLEWERNAISGCS